MRIHSTLQFRFRLVPFLAMLLVVAIGGALGQWQLRRADEKKAIDVKLTQRASASVLQAADVQGDMALLEFRRVQLRGAFVPDWPLYLDNRPYNSRAGLYVLMPFRLAGSDAVVMVERGWIARDPLDRTRVPALTTPPGLLTIEGTLRGAPGHVLQLGEASPLRPGALVQNLNLGELSRASRLSVQPYLLEQTSASADGLIRDWPRPSSGIERHLGYAFQWYALAAMAALFFVVTGFKRGNSADA